MLTITNTNLRHANERAADTGDFEGLVVLLGALYARVFESTGSHRAAYYAVHDHVWACNYTYIVQRLGISPEGGR